MYEGKTKIVVGSKSAGGLDELLQQFSADQVLYALLRMEDGDRESRRIKFIFITWVGQNVGGMAKAKAVGHKTQVQKIVGVRTAGSGGRPQRSDADLRCAGRSKSTLRCTPKRWPTCRSPPFARSSRKPPEPTTIPARTRAAILHQAVSRRRCAARAAPARAHTQAHTHRHAHAPGAWQALKSYQAKEKEGNIHNVVYVTTALPATTPVDLSNRAFVAPLTEARRNIKDTTLGRDKISGSTSPPSSPPSAAKHGREPKSSAAPVAERAADDAAAERERLAEAAAAVADEQQPAQEEQASKSPVAEPISEAEAAPEQAAESESPRDEAVPKDAPAADSCGDACEPCTTECADAAEPSPAVEEAAVEPVPVV